MHGSRTRQTVPPPKWVFGHPAGLFLVAGTEMWERFSYFGLAVLLVLFLSAPAASGGFGWPESDAVRVYGLYSGLAFSLPAIGGWLSSRYLGERRSIVVGGALIVLGHASLALPGVVPWYVTHLTGIPVESAVASSGVGIGHLVMSGDSAARLLGAVEKMHGPLSAGQSLLLNLAYLSKGWGLLAGLSFVVLGTGFIKGPISSIVGKLYRRNDPRREMGFTLFMVGIWIGSLAAELFVGLIGERLGWHVGLAAAGIGMALGMTIYLISQQSLLGDVGKTPDVRAGRTVSRRASLDAQERRKLVALGTMAVFTVIFSLAYSHYGGVWNLLVYNHVDRRVGSFAVPASWYLMTTTIAFIVLAPLAPRAYRRMARCGIELDVVRKQALALISLAGGYACFLVIARRHAADPDALLHGGWMIVGYLLFAVADILLWPPQIEAVSRLAPQRYQSFMMGLWYVTYGIGSMLGGYLAPLAYRFGLPAFAGTILILNVLAAAALFLLRDRLRDLMADAGAPVSGGAA